MSDGDLQIHVEMKDGAVARVSPEALNDPAFLEAMNQLIDAARAGVGGGGGLETVPLGADLRSAEGQNGEREAPANEKSSDRP